ncbi:uncharacterized protein LOC127748937 [Frankliniella occidentalis]|uniref:Uncharacterized protein LOC127748937 n=1 Tax=Frankliniella occidentalis TaxID=133901 RepID=A0A9C6U0E2_FRAOC|nr:uncharacterized protein LOC127748937 [Frankliniella occidentalis]
MQEPVIIKTPIRNYVHQTFDPHGFEADRLAQPSDIAEYKDVHNLLKTDKARDEIIVSIQKIQNRETYRQFWAEVEEYKLCKPNAYVYKLLHHGTGEHSTHGIVQNNLQKVFIDLQDHPQQCLLNMQSC